MRLASGARAEATSDPVVRPSVFQRVAFTFDRATLRIYRDGVEIASAAAAGTPARGRRPLVIGDGFRGEIDDVALYDRAVGRVTPGGETSVTDETAVAPPADPCGGDLAAFGDGAAPPGCWRPFATTSPFNVPLPANPRLLANSTQIVQRFLGWDQITPLVGRDRRHAGRLRAPDVLRPRHGSARHAALPRRVLPDADRGYTGSTSRSARGRPGAATGTWRSCNRTAPLYELYEVAVEGDTVYANGGGRTTISGSGVGVVNGATSAKFAVPAGVIRAQEMQAGEVRHAIFIAVKCVDGTFVYPAQGRARPCTAIGEPNTNAPPNGARFQLAMDDAEIDRLPVPPWKKTILRAMARYGLYVGDTGGGFIHAESGSTYTSFGRRDEWERFASDHLGEGGITTWISSRDGKRDYALDIERDVPWERLRVIHPCVTEATC